jgi:hypothetical protein
MSITAFEGIIENGQIRLPHHLNLPEQLKVYVIIPSYNIEPSAENSVYHLYTPHLAHPAQAQDFAKEIINEENLLAY